MKRTFACSLICNNGIVGGGLYLDDAAVTFKTNKLTVDKRYKNLMLQIEKINEITWKWIVFPVATLTLTNGERYSFIIFNKKRFNKCYLEVKENEQRQ